LDIQKGFGRRRNEEAITSYLAENEMSIEFGLNLPQISYLDRYVVCFWLTNTKGGTVMNINMLPY